MIPRKCSVLGLVEVPPNECVHIGRAIHAGQVGIKDELGDARGGLNLDLQNVRLGREKHPELQLVGGHLVGHRMRGLNEHLVGHMLRVCGVNRHADGREDVQIVGL
jgi:hypothetical protein